MKTLPAVLRGWAPELERLSDASLTAFAPWLPRLAAALGPFVAIQAADAGEPEGFDGIANRGRYERLLISEWLLAEEAPLEFMRRAASGQQLFTNLARKQPASVRCCLVLLDAGPGQLGAPRIAQLALLIVLAARAREARARLCWGIVQAPGVLHEGFDDAGVLALLGARTLKEVEAADLERWTARLCELELDAEERWLIGDPDLDALARGFEIRSTIGIREALPDPDRDLAQTLTLEVHDGARRRPRRALSLPLPAEVYLWAILKDPLRREVRAPTRPQPRFGNDWVFPAPKQIWTDPAGRRLFARAPDGRAFAFHIPSSRREKPGRTRVWQQAGNGELLAITAQGRSLIALVVENRDELALYRGAQRIAGCSLDHRITAKFIEDMIAHDDVARLLRANSPYVLFGAGRMLRVDVRDGELCLSIEASASLIAEDSSLFVRDSRTPVVYGWEPDGDARPRHPNDRFAKMEAIAFGWSLVSDAPLLLRARDGRLVIYQRDSTIDFGPAPSEESIIAPTVLTEGGETIPGVITIAANRRGIHWYERGREARTWTFDGQVRATTLCPRQRGLLVVWTDEHELWAYDLFHRETIMFQRLDGDDEEPA